MVIYIDVLAVDRQTYCLHLPRRMEEKREKKGFNAQLRYFFLFHFTSLHKTTAIMYFVRQLKEREKEKKQPLFDYSCFFLLDSSERISSFFYQLLITITPTKIVYHAIIYLCFI